LACFLQINFIPNDLWSGEMEEKMSETGFQQSRNIEALSTLAGGIAHNFNNLFMGIQANVSLMLFEIDSAHPNYKRLESIKKLVQSGSKLNNQLLGYAREGKNKVRPIRLNQLLEDTLDGLSCTKNGIQVHREFADDLYEIIGDHGQIKQVLRNLIVNAVDAMPRGGDLFFGTVNVTHKDMGGRPYEPKPGNYVLLTVIDSGTGMDKETMKHVFDPFFTTKGVGKGTGLGLSSVYGIIKAHEGYIDVYSEKGKGTAFEVYLPASSSKLTKENDLDVKVIEIKDPVELQNGD
jgi:two-component system cell cycle sensor histidine kinase/response regulator CckA